MSLKVVLPSFFFYTHQLIPLKIGANFICTYLCNACHCSSLQIELEINTDELFHWGFSGRLLKLIELNHKINRYGRHSGGESFCASVALYSVLILVIVFQFASIKMVNLTGSEFIRNHVKNTKKDRFNEKWTTRSKGSILFYNNCNINNNKPELIMKNNTFF